MFSCATMRDACFIVFKMHWAIRSVKMFRLCVCVCCLRMLRTRGISIFGQFWFFIYNSYIHISGWPSLIKMFKVVNILNHKTLKFMEFKLNEEQIISIHLVKCNGWWGEWIAMEINNVIMKFRAFWKSSMAVKLSINRHLSGFCIEFMSNGRNISSTVHYACHSMCIRVYRQAAI